MDAFFRFCTGRITRWIVVAVWVVAGLGLGSLQPKLQAATKNDPLTYLPGGSEASDALKLLRDEFASGSVTPALVLFSAVDGEALTEAQLERIGTIVEEIGAEVGDEGGDLEKSLPVRSPFDPGAAEAGQVAQDGAAVFAIVPLNGEDADRDIIPAVDRLRELAGDELPEGVDAYVTGPAGIAADSVEVFSELDGPLLLATSLLVLVLLVLTYRSPIIWMIPLVGVMLAYLLAAGMVYAMVEAGWITVNGQTTSILIVLMFGAGTDYCLLVVSRLREELRRHDDPREAVVAASRATFGAILSSGSTVVAAMLMLLLATLDSTRTMGPVLALGIAISMLGAFTLLPAMLSIGGRWAFWPRVPRHGEVVDSSTGMWHRVGRFVQRSPLRSVAISVAVLGILTLGNVVSAPSLGFGDSDSFSKPTDSTDGFGVLADHFPEGLLAQTNVIVSGDPATVGGAAAAVADALRADETRVGRVLYVPAMAERSTDGSHIQMGVILAGDPFTDESELWIAALRKTAASAADEVDGATVTIGGPTAQVLDTNSAVERDQRVIIPAVLGLILLILVLLLRAIVAPLHLIGSVILSFFATMGLVTWLFIDVLDHPGMDRGFATYLFIFVVALGVDYNIFLVHRIKEETARFGTVEGTVAALAVTGGVITSAGLVLAGTFAVLATLPVYSIKHIGIGVAIGVLLDTFIVRSFLVPAMMMLLGDRNWWPGRPPGAAAAPSGDGEVVTKL